MPILSDAARGFMYLMARCAVLSLTRLGLLNAVLCIFRRTMPCLSVAARGFMYLMARRAVLSLARLGFMHLKAHDAILKPHWTRFYASLGALCHA